MIYYKFSKTEMVNGGKTTNYSFTRKAEEVETPDKITHSSKHKKTSSDKIAFRTLELHGIVKVRYKDNFSGTGNIYSFSTDNVTLEIENEILVQKIINALINRPQNVVLEIIDNGDFSDILIKDLETDQIVKPAHSKPDLLNLMVYFADDTPKIKTQKMIIYHRAFLIDSKLY